MNWMNCNRYLFKYSNKIKILNIQIEKILNIQIKIEKKWVININWVNCNR